MNHNAHKLHNNCEISYQVIRRYRLAKGHSKPTLKNIYYIKKKAAAVKTACYLWGKCMEINYFTLGVILLLLLALVIWLVLRNRKDEKDFEEDNIDSSMVDPEDPDKE